MFHRLLFQVPENLYVDHINKNTLDNRLENLRLCTLLENMRNKPMQKNKIGSKYKGVFRTKNRTKWRARIYTKIDSKTVCVNLGCFHTEKEAAEAYNEAAIIYHKEFASLNEI